MTMTKGYERYTVESARAPLTGVNVYGWGEYPSSSVLAGQPMKCFIQNFADEESAKRAYPTAIPSNRFMEPQVRLSHLPGEDDFVPGGALPDDIGSDDNA